MYLAGAILAMKSLPQKLFARNGYRVDRRPYPNHGAVSGFVSRVFRAGEQLDVLVNQLPDLRSARVAACSFLNGYR